MATKSKVAGTPGLDPALPNVPLTIGGDTYHLCFDFNAIAQVQATTGVNLFAADPTKFDPITFRGMFWSALLRAHPDLTINDAGALITPSTIPAIAEAVSKVWNESQAEVNEGNG